MLRTSNLYRLLGTGLIALSALLVDSSALAQEPKENTPPAPAAVPCYNDLPQALKIAL